MRRAVGLTSARSEFLLVSRLVWEDLARAFDAALRDSRLETRDSRLFSRWLDFGCGCGRVARSAGADSRVPELWGVDVDARAVGWCRRHLDRERYRVIGGEPPTEFSSGFFDAAYAVSVFSHLPESAAHAWIHELARLLRTGGLLLASTHSERHTNTRPDLSPDQLRDLSMSGFLFAPGSGPFNDDSAFHTRSYLERSWGSEFALVSFREQGLGGYQDLSVWRRR